MAAAAVEAEPPLFSVIDLADTVHDFKIYGGANQDDEDGVAADINATNFVGDVFLRNIEEQLRSFGIIPSNVENSTIAHYERKPQLLTNTVNLTIEDLMASTFRDRITRNSGINAADITFGEVSVADLLQQPLRIQSIQDSIISYFFGDDVITTGSEIHFVVDAASGIVGKLFLKNPNPDGPSRFITILSPQTVLDPAGTSIGNSRAIAYDDMSLNGHGFTSSIFPMRVLNNNFSKENINGFSISIGGAVIPFQRPYTQGPSINYLTNSIYRISTGRGARPNAPNRNTEFPIVDKMWDIQDRISGGRGGEIFRIPYPRDIRISGDGNSTPCCVLFDLKRNGDQGQVNFIYQYIRDIGHLGHPYTIFCSGDRLAVLYARLLGINCIWHHGNHLILYRSPTTNLSQDVINRINKERLRESFVRDFGSGIPLGPIPTRLDNAIRNIELYIETLTTNYRSIIFTGVGDERVRVFIKSLLDERMYVLIRQLLHTKHEMGRVSEYINEGFTNDYRAMMSGIFGDLTKRYEQCLDEYNDFKRKHNEYLKTIDRLSDIVDFFQDISRRQIFIVKNDIQTYNPIEVPTFTQTYSYQDFLDLAIVLATIFTKFRRVSTIPPRGFDKLVSSFKDIVMYRILTQFSETREVIPESIRLLMASTEQTATMDDTTRWFRAFQALYSTSATAPVGAAAAASSTSSMTGFNGRSRKRQNKKKNKTRKNIQQTGGARDLSLFVDRYLLLKTICERSAMFMNSYISNNDPVRYRDLIQRKIESLPGDNKERIYLEAILPRILVPGTAGPAGPADMTAGPSDVDMTAGSDAAGPADVDMTAGADVPIASTDTYTVFINELVVLRDIWFRESIKIAVQDTGLDQGTLDPLSKFILLLLNQFIPPAGPTGERYSDPDIDFIFETDSGIPMTPTIVRGDLYGNILWNITNVKETIELFAYLYYTLYEPFEINYYIEPVRTISDIDYSASDGWNRFVISKFTEASVKIGMKDPRRRQQIQSKERRYSAMTRRFRPDSTTKGKRVKPQLPIGGKRLPRKNRKTRKIYKLH